MKPSHVIYPSRSNAPFVHRHDQSRRLKRIVERVFTRPSMSSFSSDRGGGSFDDQHNHESSSSFADEFHHQKRPLGGERHNVPHAATTTTKKNNKKRLFTLCLVASDCFLIGLQPILVHLTKNARGGFAYHPVSVNFITEATKVAFAIVFLMVQVRERERFSCGGWRLRDRMEYVLYDQKSLVV